MKYILALDAGTTSNRAILFDHLGNTHSVAQKEFQQFFPHPGWVEQNPKEIVSTTLAMAVEAIVQGNIPRESIAAIGITNQRETTIVWDRKTGEPIYNAIVWQCRRTADQAEELKKKGYTNAIREKTGLVIDAYFSATKIKYILDAVPGSYERAKKGELAFGTVDSYLLYHLTGGKVHATDPSNACRTMLYNIVEEKWDEEILELLDIPKEILPEVKDSNALFGESDPQLFGRSIPISGILGDQQAALFGQMCFDKGEVKNTYGTGAFVLMNTGGEPIFSQHGLLTSIAWKLKGEISYALEGSIFTCGSAISWLKNEMNFIEKPEDSEKMAQSVEDTNGVFFVPAFTGLGTPYWDSNARGTLLGLSNGTKKEHIVRATLESIALMSYDVIHAMELDSGIEHSLLKVDGGVAKNEFLLEFQANILQEEVQRSKTLESTALGACFMAGLGVGLYKDTEEIKKMCEDNTIFTPNMDLSTRNEILSRWHNAIKTASYFGDGTKLPEED